MAEAVAFDIARMFVHQVANVDLSKDYLRDTKSPHLHEIGNQIELVRTQICRQVYLHDHPASLQACGWEGYIHMIKKSILSAWRVLQGIW